MISASAQARTVSRVVSVAPAVVAAGLFLAGVLQRDGATVLEIGCWTLGFVVTGAGIGMAWPHLAAAAMSVSDDGSESGTGAAAISTVQLIAGALVPDWPGCASTSADRPDTAHRCCSWGSP